MLGAHRLESSSASWVVSSYNLPDDAAFHGGTLHGRQGTLMTVKATHGRFRRFGVSTDEKLEGRAGQK